MQLKGFVKCFVVGNGITNARGNNNFRWVEDGWPVVLQQNWKREKYKKKQNINSNVQDQDDTYSSYLLTKMQTSTTSH